MNYIILGWQFPVDGFYMHSFEIWLATTVVFIGSGNVGFTLLEYRLGQKPIVSVQQSLHGLCADNHRSIGERLLPEHYVDSVLVSTGAF